jgi:GT2 family glycosyltransferase
MIAARTRLEAPAVLVDVDLAGPLPGGGWLSSQHAGTRSVRLFVRLHGHPIGMIDLGAADLASADLRSVVWTECRNEIQGHLAKYHSATADGIPAGGFGDKGREACSWRAAVSDPEPDATIVINSCAASGSLERTIKSALQQDYPNAGLVVVDNRPATSGIRAFLNDRFRKSECVTYVTEPQPGLGRARNAGLRAATTQIVAFTDDDVVLDQSWLGWLVAGFHVTDRVGCVTGLIVPLELETKAQVFMEDFSGFAKGFEQRTWDRDEHRLDHPLYPYTVGLFGSGASAAFRREVLVDLGGFDRYLGIGTPAIGGEDIDIYTRMVLRGHRIVYQPTSVLRHLHRRDMTAVNRQIHGYGAGLGAMLAKHVLADRLTRRAVLRRIPAGLRYAVSPRSPKNARKPPEFTMRQSLLEWAGMAYGPIGYVRSRLAG